MYAVFDCIFGCIGFLMIELLIVYGQLNTTTKAVVVDGYSANYQSDKSRHPK